MIRTLYYFFKDTLYYARVLFKYFVFAKPIICYTKYHPIYSESFENSDSNFVFCFDPGEHNPAILVKYIRHLAKAFHIDAARAEHYFGLIRADLPVVIECEGRPRESFFLNKRVKHVVVESKWAGGAFLADGTVRLIYPGIRQRIIKRSDRDTDYFTICAVGYGGMIKGFDVVYRLYNYLKIYHKVKLIVAGAFGHNYDFYPEITKEAYAYYDFEDIAENLRSDPNVIFKVFKRNELFDEVYKNADVYLHLSRLETFGFSILEAMSFGLPIIASKLHAIPEMVVHEENGFLIDSFRYDINSLDWHNNTYLEAKQHLICLIENKELRMKYSLNSLNKSLEFASGKRIFELEKLYSDIVK